VSTFCVILTFLIVILILNAAINKFTRFGGLGDLIDRLLKGIFGGCCRRMCHCQTGEIDNQELQPLAPTTYVTSSTTTAPPPPLVAADAAQDDDIDDEAPTASLINNNEPAYRDYDEDNNDDADTYQSGEILSDADFKKFNKFVYSLHSRNNTSTAGATPRRPRRRFWIFGSDNVNS
jgi:hypothetical protein